jgi:hypothetical protein
VELSDLKVSESTFENVPVTKDSWLTGQQNMSYPDTTNVGVTQISFLAVLWIRDVYPGSRILMFFHP